MIEILIVWGFALGLWAAYDDLSDER